MAAVEILRGYEEKRRELQEIWRGCQDLSEQFAVATGRLEEDGAIIRALFEPVRLAFLGDDSSGREQLVRELAGAEAFAHSGEESIWFRHKDRVKEASVEGAIPCRRLDDPQLRHLELLSLALDGVEAGAPELQAREATDLSILVFSTLNPWSAAAWSWLERQCAAGRPNCLLVVRIEENFGEKERAAMLRHMRDICLRRTGLDLPLCELPVGAEGEPLKHLLGKTFGEHRGLRARLLQASDMLDARQQSIEEVLEGKRRLLREDGGFLDELERGVLSLRNEMLSGVSGIAAEGGQVYLDASAKGLVRLRGHLGIFPRWWSLVRGERLPKRFDRELYEQAVRRYRDWAGGLFDRLLGHLEEDWKELAPETGRQLRLELGEFPADELHALKGKLQDEAEELLRKVLLKISLRKLLLRELQHYQLLIGSWFFLGTLIWIAGAWLGVAGVSLAGLIAVATAGVCFLMSGLRVIQVRREIQEQVRRRLVGAAAELEQELEEVLGQEVRMLTARYRGCFAPVNQHIAKSREKLLPRFEHWRALYLRLKSLQQQL